MRFAAVMAVVMALAGCQSFVDRVMVPGETVEKIDGTPDLVSFRYAAGDSGELQAAGEQADKHCG
jgi:hypothetical protein